MSAGELGTRRLASWIEGFNTYTAGLPSPPIFRLWTAISCLAGAMERRIWIRQYGMELFPNMYIMLVGPPGVGKTVALRQCEHLWRSVKDFHIAPSSVTKASLMDALAEAKRKILCPTEVPPFIEYHSLLTLAGELGVFIPTYDHEFMNALVEIWDNPPSYSESRRTNKIKISTPLPQLNIAAGTTPSYLNTFLPAGAWDQGFMARNILIFSGDKILPPPFDSLALSTSLWADLAHDLKIISTMYGRMEWEADAAAAYTHWHNNGQEPIPEHNRLLSYTQRRPTHLSKLCMVASISRSSDRRITLQDYQTALDWLIEAEFYMPDIFKSMASGGDSNSIEDTWHYIWTIYAKEKKPIAEHRIVHFLQQRVPAYAIARVLEAMINSNMIEVAAVGERGRNLYKPTPKQTHAA